MRVDVADYVENQGTYPCTDRYRHEDRMERVAVRARDRCNRILRLADQEVDRPGIGARRHDSLLTCRGLKTRTYPLTRRSNHAWPLSYRKGHANALDRQQLGLTRFAGHRGYAA